MSLLATMIWTMVNFFGMRENITYCFVSQTSQVVAIINNKKDKFQGFVKIQNVLLLESHVKLEEFVDRLHHLNVQRLFVMEKTILKFETINLISKIIDIF
jgi:hypothetical protein